MGRSMENIGVVKVIQEDMATIEIRRVSACGENCASCKGGCTPTAHHVKAKNSVNAKVGQLVKLEMNNKKVLKAAFLVYIIPLIGMITGIILGIEVGGYLGYEGIAEWIGLGVGILFLIILYLGLNIIDKRLKGSNTMEITITKIIS